MVGEFHVSCSCTNSTLQQPHTIFSQRLNNVEKRIEYTYFDKAYSFLTGKRLISADEGSNRGYDYRIKKKITTKRKCTPSAELVKLNDNAKDSDDWSVNALALLIIFTHTKSLVLSPLLITGQEHV